MVPLLPPTAAATPATLTSPLSPSTKNWLCGDKINHEMPHHKSVKALWEYKWKKNCIINAFPFAYATVSDMEPLIDELQSKGIHDAYKDEWTEVFLPHIERMENEAIEAEKAGDLKKAEDLYLRVSSVCMIARFPIINSDLKRQVWNTQKRLHLKGSSFWKEPIENLIIPNTTAKGNDKPTLELYIRRPKLPAGHPPTPVFINLTGLDGYRTDGRPPVIHRAVELGYTCFLMEIPGTGDAAGDPSDPESTDRQTAALLDWIAAQPELDEKRVVLLGTSTGGYDAMRVAHTMPDRLAYVLAQGGASDLSWSKEWLDRADGGEYPFPLCEALRIKFGFDTIDDLKEHGVAKFGLAANGIFDRDCTELTILNGIDDTIFPIEDSMAPLRYGRAKAARFYENVHHMGEPMASNEIMKMLGEYVKNWNRKAAAAAAAAAAALSA